MPAQRDRAFCMRCILVIVNIIFFLVGAGLLAGGVIIKLQQNMIHDFLDEFISAIPSLSEGAGLNDTATVDSAGGAGLLNIEAILTGLAGGLMAIGLFMFLMGFFGCCGAICRIRIYLYIYATVMGLIILIQVGLVAVIASGKFTATIKEKLENTLAEYEGIDASNPESLAWNALQLNFECCGVTSYEDFDQATNWEHVREFDFHNGTSGNASMVIPISCCKTSGSFPDVEPIDHFCPLDPDDANSYWKDGCYDTIYDFAMTFKMPVMAAGGGTIIIELVLLIFACCVARTVQPKRTQREQAYRQSNVV